MPIDDEADRRIGEAGLVRETFDAFPTPIAVLGGPPEFPFVAVNAAYRALTGRTDFIGGPMREVFDDLAGQRIYESIEAAAETGETQLMREWRIHLETPEGPLEFFLDCDIVPSGAPDGTVRTIACYLTIVTDRVLERRAAREQVAAAERRYEQARDVIAELQRELLPAGLPVLPGARIAASYLLADNDSAAGGDWFDALPLPDGRVALVVGDVVGHGVAASAAMGQLRAVLGERLRTGGSVDEALAAGDALASRLRGARAATVCLALLDPEDGTLTYSTAGHPPPLVVPAHGEPRFLQATGAGPLGVGSGLAVSSAQLDVGDVVLLYTDGILERPGRPIAASTVELAQVAADSVAGRSLRFGETSPVERACTHTLELLVRETGHDDDITLLAAQRVAAPAPFAEAWPAEVSAVPRSRAAISGWLADAGVDGQEALGVQHAVGELVTNAVEHAYPAGATGEIRVRLDLTAEGLLLAEVTDGGRWREASTDPRETFGRGRGLAMSRELADTLLVDRAPTGTTVTVTLTPMRPARLLTAGEIAAGSRPAASPPGEELFLVLDQPGGDGAARIRVDGPVDITTAASLHAELRRRTQGGSRALTVDLTGVTHLASAGVAVLYQAGLDAGPDAPLDLVAPVDSPAGYVLDLVALPHRTRETG
ncbi:sigma-F factor regulator [Pseudonocardia ailaonensis]|uniref:Sigma-F factor regulator n=1 Tax=Pseudonocardia ailaonensis TaxID=367279 RepID=A0ABN2N988_9PSEU